MYQKMYKFVGMAERNVAVIVTLVEIRKAQPVCIENTQDIKADLQLHYSKQQWHASNCQRYKRKREKVQQI